MGAKVGFLEGREKSLEGCEADPISNAIISRIADPISRKLILSVTPSSAKSLLHQQLLILSVMALSTELLMPSALLIISSTPSLAEKLMPSVESSDPIGNAPNPQLPILAAALRSPEGCFILIRISDIICQQIISTENGSAMFK